MNIPKTHKKYITLMMVQALIIVVLEILSIVLSLLLKNVLPFVIGLVVCLVLAYVLANYYYYGSSFKCSECDEVFKPSKSDFMKSVHIKKGRTFHCPDCNKTVVCKEGFIYGDIYR